MPSGDAALWRHGSYLNVYTDCADRWYNVQLEE
jgi:hypothetical protein